jgi:hypothetical protein
LDTPKHATDEEEEPFNISNMVAFAPPPDNLESKEEDEKDEVCMHDIYQFKFRLINIYS